MPVHINESSAQAANQDFAKAAGMLNEFIQDLIKRLEQDRSDAAQLQAKMVDIRMGRNIVYRGVPGEEPQINKLTPDKVKLLKSAIAQSEMPSQQGRAEGSAKPGKGVIDIKTYNPEQRDQTEETVFRRAKGLTEVNLFAPEAQVDRQHQYGSEEAKPLSDYGYNDPEKLLIAEPGENTPDPLDSERAMTVGEAGESAEHSTNNQPAIKSTEKITSRFEDLNPEALQSAKQKVMDKAGKALEEGGVQSRDYQTYFEAAKRFEQIQQHKGLLPENAASSDIADRVAQQIKDVVAQNQKQSPQEASQALQILPVVVVVQREIEKIKDGPAKDWIKGSLDAIRDQTAQTAKNLPDKVASIPQRIKERQIATTATQILAHYGERKGHAIACQTEKFQITAHSKSKFSIQDHQGNELMRFEQGMLGPKVLESNLTKREEKEFLHAYSQVRTHGGVDKISEDSSMRLRQLGSLAPLGDLQASRQATNHECFESASKVAQYLGRDRGDGVSVFKGDKYVVQQSGDQLMVTARDGRGEILSNRDGQVQGSLSIKDVSALKNIAQKIDRDISQRQIQQTAQVVPVQDKERKLAGAGIER